jgi:hypothetical protein
MSTLQQFSDEQEMEFYAAISDIKNAVEKFGANIVLVALAEIISPDEEDLDLTNAIIPDTMYVQ